MPKVFIPHLVTKYDHARDKIVPTFDFRPASKFGELVLLLDDQVDTAFYQQTIEKLKVSLSDITIHDYFVPVGDPSIIAACAAIIADKIGVIRLLKWDRQSRSYLELRGFL